MKSAQDCLKFAKDSLKPEKDSLDQDGVGQDNMAKGNISHWVKSRSDVLALITPSQRYTWGELNKRVAQCSHRLIAQGLISTDVLACISKNCADLVIVYLACVRVGIIPALIAPQPKLAVQAKLEQLGCKYFWLGEGANAAFNSDSTTKAQHDESVLFPSAKQVFTRAPESQVKYDVSAITDLHAIVSLVFTSGSTGQPKAVAHSAKNHLKSAKGLFAVFPFNSSDSWLLSLPMFHVSGLAILWRWLSVGAVLKVGEGVDLKSDLIDVTHASLVPVQLQRLLDANVTLSLSHVLLGGSDIPVQLAVRAQKRGIDTWLGYGMTEAASTVTAKRVDGKKGVGQVLCERQLKIEQKRIMIAGNTLAQGYYYKGNLLPISDDDWFDSGDLGEWKDDELHILGREDNQFISGGENIHCEEIESVLSKHVDIDLVFVVAVKDTEYGARPVALISSKLPIQPDRYQALLKSQLEKFKWPIDYILLPNDVLQTGGIKISRYSVNQWFNANQSRYIALNSIQSNS